MRTPQIYLAHPIDQADGRVYDFLLRELERAQLRVFHPAGAFGGWLGGEVDSRIAAVCDFALRRCDGLFAALPAGIPSFGVPMEIERAAGLGLPVAVLTDFPSFALQDPRLRVFYEHEYADAADWLARQCAQRPDYVPGELVDSVVPLPYVRESHPRTNGLQLLQRGYPDDAGLDLVVTRTVDVDVDEFADVPCGLSIELPPDAWALITGRSSTIRRRKLMVTQGVIDPGYRGPLFAGVWNLGGEKVRIERGERIAQLILFPNLTRQFRPVEVSELSPSDRGTAGFGSTGA